MRLSSDGLRRLAILEGEELVAYPDTGGVLTIGFGHTGPDVKRGMRITRARAFALLRRDVRTAEAAVNKYVKVGLNRHRFDALVIFVYNIGVGNFRSSTVLRKLNARDYRGASAHLMDWVKVKGRTVQGLVNRRRVEKALFDRPVR